MACFNSGKINDFYVECNFVLLCLENKGWREWVIRCLWSLLSNGKIYSSNQKHPATCRQTVLSSLILPIHVITSASPLHLSHHFIISLFHSLCQSGFECLPSLVCTHQPSRELRGLPHQQVHHEVCSVSTSTASATDFFHIRYFTRRFCLKKWFTCCSIKSICSTWVLLLVLTPCLFCLIINKVSIPAFVLNEYGALQQICFHWAFTCRHLGANATS